MQDIQNIAVLGAGSWGTALADTARRAGKNVILYARDAGLAAHINAHHENNIYLSGTPLHPALKATADMAAALDPADIVLAVTPVQFMRGMLAQARPHLKAGVPVVNCAKGVEIASGLLPHRIVADVLPDHPYANLSGPTFATEVIAGLPAAATLASADARVADWAQSLSSRMFRLYPSRDVVGTEICGAAKNVLAIACGIVEGRGMGQNARAAVMTRGMAEIRRYGLSLGAQAESFLGLAGVGDVMLTCHSMTSRNFSLGAQLGAGERLADILSARRTVAEGVATAAALAAIAARDGIDMPISEGVAAILAGTASVDDVIDRLLSRAIKPEHA